MYRDDEGGQEALMGNFKTKNKQNKICEEPDFCMKIFFISLTFQTFIFNCFVFTLSCSMIRIRKKILRFLKPQI